MKKLMLLPVALLLLTGFLVIGCQVDEGNSDITYTVTANGVEHKETSTTLFLSFSANPSGLANSDITITAVDCEVTKGSLSSSGPNRTLGVTVVTPGVIKVQINKSGITSAEKTVTVYQEAGFEDDATVDISQIVKFTNINASANKAENSSDANVTFGRFRGDPVAVLAPKTTEPVTSESEIAQTYNLAGYTTPLDWKTTPAGLKLAYIDMEWAGFGSNFEFDEESTGHENGNTTKFWDLHKVDFDLTLKASNGTVIVFSGSAETNKDASISKKPVRFLINSISAGDWADGYDIVEVSLAITDIQLRVPPAYVESGDGDWEPLSAERNASFTDLYVISLTATFAAPPPPLVLYTTADGWNSIIKNPRTGYAGSGTAIPGLVTGGDPVTDLTDFATDQNGRRTVLIWDPIEINSGFTKLVIKVSPVWTWAGWGLIGTGASGGFSDWNDANTGGASGGSIILPFDSWNSFNKSVFGGFWIQGNGSYNTDGTFSITEIRVE